MICLSFCKDLEKFTVTKKLATPHGLTVSAVIPGFTRIKLLKIKESIKSLRCHKSQHV